MVSPGPDHDRRRGASIPETWHPHPRKAVHIMPGIFHRDGDASSIVSFGKSLRAVLPWVTNHGGTGAMRKGARKTVFCGRSNINVLCTTPVPDWISYISRPGKAPQLV